MADLLGLNSVLSLSGCIVQIFKTIEDVRHAPREVQDLKKQADALHEVISALATSAAENEQSSSRDRNVGSLTSNALQKAERSLGASGASLTSGITEDTPASESSIVEEEQQQHLEVIRPASPLELSPAFMPELYTVQESTPNLFTNRSQQLDLSEHTLTNLYSMFYRARGRRWIRVTASVTISVESSLFQLGRLAPESITGREPLGPVAKEIKQLLDAQRDEVEADAHVDLYIGARFLERRTSPSVAPSAAAKLAKSSPHSLPIKACLREAAGLFYHARYHFIPDAHVVQIPLPRLVKGFFFLSSYQSEWMFDFRFGLDAEANKNLLYCLKALHHLRGCDGICELVGLVTDHDEDAKDTVKGFLIRLPPGGHLLHYLGHLGHSGFRGVCLDGSDGVVLYCFYPVYRYSQSILESIVPPEHRQRAAEIGGRGTMPATPQTDIFQLGMMIWLIASGRESKPHDMEIKGTQLPHLDGEVPEYINQIIAECRKEQASERKAAWELLSMFPSTPPSSNDGGETATVAPSLDLYKQLYYYSILGHCDSCSKPLPGCSYECSVCYLGDFDLCPSCFDAGKHYLNDDHHLGKHGFDEAGSKLFYSSRRGGRREVVDLRI